MKLIHIQINEDIDIELRIPKVTLTFRNWLGFKKTIKAYPTSNAVTDGSIIDYLNYCDSAGKEFNHDICIQIFNCLSMNGRHYKLKK